MEPGIQYCMAPTMPTSARHIEDGQMQLLHTRMYEQQRTYCQYCSEWCHFVADEAQGAVICKQCGSHIDICLDDTAFGRYYVAAESDTIMNMPRAEKVTASVLAEVESETMMDRTYINGTRDAITKRSTAKRATDISELNRDMRGNKKKKYVLLAGNLVSALTGIGEVHNRFSKGNKELEGVKTGAVREVVKRGIAFIETQIKIKSLSPAVMTSAVSMWTRLCKIKKVDETKRSLYRTEAIIASLVHLASIECYETVSLNNLVHSCDTVKFNTKKTLKRVLSWLGHTYFSHYHIAEGYIRRFCGTSNLKLDRVYAEAAILILHTFRDQQLSTKPKPSSTTLATDTKAIRRGSMVPELEFPESKTTYQFHPNSPMFRVANAAPTPAPIVLEDATRRDPRCLAISCIYSSMILGNAPTKLPQTELSKYSGVASNSISKAHNLICTTIEDVIDSVALLNLFRPT